MLNHPSIAAAVAAERRRDLMAHAEASRLARSARSNHSRGASAASRLPWQAVAATAVVLAAIVVALVQARSGHLFAAHVLRQHVFAHHFLAHHFFASARWAVHFRAPFVHFR